MKIKQVKVSRHSLGLSRPYTIAFKSFGDVENGIIEVHSYNGLVGMGAFNPCFEVIGETLDEALAVLTEERLEWLTGQTLNNVQELSLLLHQLHSAFYISPSACTGLEIALYDIFTQHIRLPLVKFLGQKIQAMPTSVTIGIRNVTETIEEGRTYLGIGFRILKIKLGISPEEDLERLVKLREQLGSKFRLIVDINQGYSVPQLLVFYEKTKDLKIELIEQPFPVGQEAAMAKLPVKIKKVIAADESLINADDARMLTISPGCCGIFNIKLMKCSGITGAISIMEVAENKNIRLMWGCNDESIISITAALHLAFASRQTKFIDLDGSFDLARDVVAGGFILKEGHLSLPDANGLGLKLFSV